MKNIDLPRRVFNSPLLEYANFEDDCPINLIRLHKSYANGKSYAVYHPTNKKPLNGVLFTSFEKAKKYFDNVISSKSKIIKMLKQGITQNKP